MAFALGTEFREEYLAFEVTHAARKAVQEVMPVSPGENVVISCDTSGDGRGVKAVAQAVYAVGAHPIVIWYETQPDAQMEPPKPVADVLRTADVWFEFGFQYILYTEARKAATAAGCRHTCYGGMDVDMLVRTIGRIDYPAMTELGHTLRELCMAAEEVQLRDENGTDLRCPVDPNPTSCLGGRQPGAGYSQMLGEQSGFSAKIDDVSGVMVFAGAIWPPVEVGSLHQPVTLEVDARFVTKIDGGAEARVFSRWMEKFNNRQMYRLAHISFGFNPGVTGITGRIVEDECVFGCLDIGIGPQNLGAPSHTDGIILRPTIVADGVDVERDGEYVHPELRELVQRLGVG